MRKQPGSRVAVNERGLRGLQRWGQLLCLVHTNCVLTVMILISEHVWSLFCSIHHWVLMDIGLITNCMGLVAWDWPGCMWELELRREPLTWRKKKLLDLRYLDCFSSTQRQTGRNVSDNGVDSLRNQKNSFAFHKPNGHNSNHGPKNSFVEWNKQTHRTYNGNRIAPGFGTNNDAQEGPLLRTSVSSIPLDNHIRPSYSQQHFQQRLSWPLHSLTTGRSSKNCCSTSDTLYSYQKTQPERPYTNKELYFLLEIIYITKSSYLVSHFHRNSFEKWGLLDFNQTWQGRLWTSLFWYFFPLF